MIIVDRRLFTVVYDNINEGEVMFENAVHGGFNVTKFERLLRERRAEFQNMTIPISREHAAYVRQFIGLDDQQIKDMSEQRRDMPLYAVWLDDPAPLLLIDGHHRLMKRWNDGLREAEVWVMPTEMIPEIKIRKEKIRK